VTSTDTPPKRAVVYTRISKDREGAGLGVGKQESDCRALAERLHPPVEIVTVYTDNDLTAFKGSKHSKPREGYNALLADIRNDRADVVLAWHTDRLHRDLTELEDYVDVCQPRGIPTYTVKGGNLDLTTASGRMVARILGAVAKQEVEHMIERQLSAKERIRKAGGRQGGPPGFGYRSDGPSLKNGGRGALVQDPEEAAAIRKGYDMLLQLDPEHGMYAIARQWNYAGHRTPRGASRGGGGNLWDPKTVRIVLLRARNAGLVEHKGKIVGKGNWEPIVSEDTWRAAVRILNDPARHSGPGPKPKHLLTGILICGVCGGNRFIVAQPANSGRSRRRPVYKCASLSLRPGPLPDGMKRAHLTRLQEPVDKYVEQIIVKRLRDPRIIAGLNTRPEVNVAALDARRTEINTELDEWATAPGITPRQLQIHNEPLLAELASIERKISDALRADPLPEFTGKDPAKVWPDLPMDRKRAIAKMLLRVRLEPLGRPGRAGFNYDAVKIEWQRP
jgi:DNA invertase Pin-like site-specific DNA recombinase